MTSIAQGIKDQLTTHVGISGWTLEIASLPADPDKVSMITITGGEAPNPKWLLDFPTAQVMVRGVVGGYFAAEAEAVAVKDLLLGKASQTVNGDRWVSITMASDVGYLGMDENQRPLFSVNFRFIIEPAASGDTQRQVL